MTVGELKKLLTEMPDQISREAFDDLVVTICTDGEHFLVPETDKSGYMEFTNPCDENGNIIPGEMDPIPFFGIVANVIVSE
ncbi:hypothetical protein LL912_00830 [Niabella sp. CC-SYL272]|uniref:hypothetical protein n=1 Tax=Niabella agricola TaxID=2891571 RepID=UPI001F3F9D72|nr:hypothetical protein [Niabella agricola]MCF3107311.1 hypothetical protein [Niabella agricola]